MQSGRERAPGKIRQQEEVSVGTNNLHKERNSIAQILSRISSSFPGEPGLPGLWSLAWGKERNLLGGA